MSIRLSTVIALLIAGLLLALPDRWANAADTLIPIYRLQGSGAVSPLRERWLNTSGVISAVAAEGFYLQDAAGDGNPATSDGLYVYWGEVPEVKVGECVEVHQAWLDEFNDKTELSRTRRVTLSNVCAGQILTPSTIRLAHLYGDPAALFEHLEGMLVQIEGLRGVVQGPTKRFASGEAEITLLAEAYQVHLPGGRVYQSRPFDMSGLIFLSSALGSEFPDLRWGDRVEIGGAAGVDQPALAVLDYNFGKYQLLLLPNQTIHPLPQPAPTAEAAQPAAADEVTLCSLNLWALGQGSAQIPEDELFQQALRKRARAIAETLAGCTAIGLQEAGSRNVVTQLAAILQNDYGLIYTGWAGEGYQADNLEFPLTNGLLVRADRVTLESVGMQQSCSPIDYETLPGAHSCPTGQYPLFDRPPLLATLEIGGDWGEPYRLHIIVNHLKSKVGDEAINEPRRLAQARHVAALVQTQLQRDARAQVVVLGDLNDYYGSATVESLRSGVTPALLHVYDLLPALDRYTYIFNGGSQALDHLLITPILATQVSEVNILHINADFAYPKQVDVSQVFHASDHDPVLLRLRPGGAATLGGTLRYPGIRLVLRTATGETAGVQTSDDAGEFRFWQLKPGQYTLQLEPPAFIKIAPMSATITLQPGDNRLPAYTVQHAGLALLQAALAAAPVLSQSSP